MVEIEKVSKLIEKKISDAKDNIDFAMEIKENFPRLSNLLYRISLDEIAHMTALHEEVVNIIMDYKQAHGDIPHDMKIIYEYLHKEHIKYANKVQIIQALFNK